MCMKTYVTTGATTGIGAAVREALQARGDRVVNIEVRDADIEVDRAAQRLGSACERRGRMVKTR